MKGILYHFLMIVGMCMKKNEKIINKINSRIYWTGVLIVSIVFFFFLGEKGPVLFADSASYIDGEEYVRNLYPIYSWFIFSAKIIFKEKIYLWCVFFLQSILAFCSCVFLTEVLRKQYKYSYSFSIIIYCLSLLPFGYDLPNAVSSHHILTEGLSIPIFYLFITVLLRIIFDGKDNMNKIYILYIFLLAILLYKTRTQFLIIVIATGIFVAVYFLKDICGYTKMHATNRMPAVMMAAACAALLLVGTIIFLTVAKYFPISNQLNVATRGRILCLARSSTMDLKQKRTEEAYEYLYNQMKKGGLLSEQFGKGLDRIDSLLAASNEINKSAAGWMSEYYVQNGYNSVVSSEDIESDLAEICREILSENWMFFVGDILLLTINSMVFAVFIQPSSIREVCYIVAGILHLGYVITLLGALKRHHTIYALPGEITIIILFINCFMTNVIMYGLQRYVIYTFGLFYISWLLMLLANRKGFADENSND